MGAVILILAWGGASLLPLLLHARQHSPRHRGVVPAGVGRGTRLLLAALVAAFVLAGPAAALPPPPPTTYTVTRVDDPAPNGCSSADCSLREAVLAANAAPNQTEVIVALPAGQYRLTRPIAGLDTPQTGDLDLLRDVTIAGAGAAATAIGAGGIDRVIDIGATAVVTIRGVTLRDGNARVSGIDGGGVSHDHGGAIHNHGILTLVDSTIRDSFALATQPNGGGLYNAAGATAILRTVTVALNTALTGGGVENGGDLLAVHTTITRNEGTIGGGIRTTGAGANTIVNTIIGGNHNAGVQGSPDCAGALGSPRYSLIQDLTGCTIGTSATGTIAGFPPRLVDLQGAAGYTFAYEPQPASPALDAADPQHCLGSDQRGLARPQGPGCDIGAVELRYVTLTTAAQGAGSVAPGTGGHPAGSAVTLVPTPASPADVFIGWTVDGQFRGWANPLTITMDADHAVAASFAPVVPFGDVGVGQPFTRAVVELAARGTIRGYADGTYGPDDGVQRAQMAALIARATAAGPGTPPTTLAPPACLVAGTWDCEDWGTAFTDQSGDPNLWRNAGTLQHYGVALGYAAGDCAAKGRAFPCYGPSDPVSHAQTITFIVRMLRVKGYWVAQPGAPLPYSGVPGPHAEDVRTFAFYAGGVPAPPANWNATATRGWFAMALWAALDRYWGSDAPGSGGYVP